MLRPTFFYRFFNKIAQPLLVFLSFSLNVVAQINSPGVSITSISPTSGHVGTSVTIAGKNFGSTQGTSTVTFNSVQATPTRWSSTSIVSPVPSTATTGSVVVKVAGVASNGVTFTVIPAISTLSPTSGAGGASVTISGSGFGPTQGTSTVFFGTAKATSIANWSATSIVATVPGGATTGNVTVNTAGGSSNGVNFTVVPPPSVSSLSPSSGAVGASVTITGTNFGSTQGTGTVSFNGTLAAATSWSATSIVTTVPSAAMTGNVVVYASGVNSNGVSFTVTPNIGNLSPNSGPVGTQVTITGTTFGSTQGTSTVKFNGTSAAPTNWSAGSITVPVPSGATTGNVVVTVNGVASNGVNFTVTVPAPTLQSITVNPANATMDIANTQQYSAIGTYSDGSTQDVTASSAWTSSSPAVATIDGSALVKTVNQGQTTIQATNGGISGSTGLTVSTDLTITTAYQSQYAGQDFNHKQIALGPDGFARFVTGDLDSQNHLEWVYVRCLDADCATSNTQAFDTGITSGGDSSISIGPDGFARIAYTNWDSLPGCRGSLYFVQCTDANCGGSTPTFVDNIGDQEVVSIATGSDGTSHILYDNQPEGYTCDVGPTNINLATCTSGGACSPTQIDQLDSDYGDIVGGAVTMAPDGNPAVAYTDLVANPGGPPNSIYYSHNGSRELISNDLGDFMVDLAFATDGSARVLFPAGGAKSLNMAKCADPSCASTSVTVLAPPGYSDGFFSEAVDANGNPQIGVDIPGFRSDSLGYVQCTAPDCSKYAVHGLAGNWDGEVSLVLGLDGFAEMVAQEYPVQGSPNKIDHAKAQQIPTTLSIVPGTDSTDPETLCQVQGIGPGCKCARSFTYQVNDQNGQPLKQAGLEVWDEISTTSPNNLLLTSYDTTCNGPGPCGVTTDANGQFQEYSLRACSTVCLSNGQCVTGGPTNADQTVHIGASKIVQKLGYYCDHFTVNGN